MLLLDEPTQNLDIGRQVELLDLLASLRAEGVTLFASMHDLHLVQGNFTEVHLLAPGEPLLSGPPEAILTPALLSEAFHCPPNRHPLLDRAQSLAPKTLANSKLKLKLRTLNTFPPIATMPPSASHHAKARAHLDTLTKPLGSLGRLEDLAAQIVAIREGVPPLPLSKAVYVFAADHGITAEGVSAYPRAVTHQMVLNFLAGGAAINVLARLHSVALTVVDMGVDADLPQHPQLLHHKLARGTANMLHGPALSSDQLDAALASRLGLAAQAAGTATPSSRSARWASATPPRPAPSPAP